MPALIAAAVALAKGNSLFATIGNVLSRLNAPSDDLQGIERELRGATGSVIAITSLAILFHVLVIILRFCNIGLINLMIEKKIWTPIVKFIIHMCTACMKDPKLHRVSDFFGEILSAYDNYVNQGEDERVKFFVSDPMCISLYT